MEATYVFTAEMDDASLAWLDGLRCRHFPPERNFLPAHLMLFHRQSPARVARLRSWASTSFAKGNVFSEASRKLHKKPTGRSGTLKPTRSVRIRLTEPA